MRWRIFLKSVLAFVALVLLAWFGYTKWFGAPKQDGSAEWSTTEVTLGSIGRSLQLSGTIKPLLTWKVTSQVNGKIHTVAVKDGDLVTKGQVLIKLDEDELKSKLAQAKVALLKAQARAKELENWRSSPAYIDSQASLQISQGELEAKELEYQQNQQLFQAKAIAKQDLDRSKLDLARSRADLAKSEAQMAEYLEKVGPQTREEVQAELFVAELALREARENLAQKDIRAPDTGIVHFPRSGGEGRGMATADTTLAPKSSVSAGQLLLTIESRRQFAVEASINEHDVFNLRPDQMCMITVPALPKTGFSGRIESISIEPYDKVTLFKVLCQIKPPSRPEVSRAPNTKEDTAPTASKQDKNSGERDLNPEIVVGMNAHVRIPLDGKKNVLLVPVTALVKREGGAGVFVIEQGKPVFTKVRVGIITSDKAEILNGLAEGDEILEDVPLKLMEKPTSESSEE